MIGILLPRFLNLEWMAERRRFSSSHKNCMGVILRGTSQMTILRNSIVLCAAIIVDPAESTQGLRLDCRK
ncbi:hypothetical protein CDL12_29549 [Handroanthus impetiginosus]|uniref:Uncharacterized protein n=1 Tax=Handroanthus impetiginosus TaxID=429701 RepID=A0A2G9FY37_9LAMI|nr:hypothetical protein CDL12_29549 [Handroanthus impetiginosus]